MGYACLYIVLFSFPRKVRSGNCEQGFEGKLIPKKSSLSSSRGVTLNRRARVHNNFKTGDLLLKRKLSYD